MKYGPINTVIVPKRQGQSMADLIKEAQRRVDDVAGVMGTLGAVPQEHSVTATELAIQHQHAARLVQQKMASLQDAQAQNSLLGSVQAYRANDYLHAHQHGVWPAGNHDHGVNIDTRTVPMQEYVSLKNTYDRLCERFKQLFEIDPRTLRSDFDRPAESPGHLRLRVHVPARTYECTVDEYRLASQYPGEVKTWVQAVEPNAEVLRAAMVQKVTQQITASATAEGNRIEVIEYGDMSAFDQGKRPGDKQGGK